MEKLKGLTSHHECELEELKIDQELAIIYLRMALESMDDPENRPGALLALRNILQAHA